MLNKVIIAGIIAAVIITGVLLYAISNDSPKPTVLPGNPEPQTSGRNLTINLNEGLNLRASP